MSECWDKYECNEWLLNNDYKLEVLKEKTNIDYFLKSYLKEKYKEWNHQIEKEKILDIISSTWNRDDIALLRNYIAYITTTKNNEYIKDYYDDLAQLWNLKKGLLELLAWIYNNIDITSYPSRKEQIEVMDKIDFTISEANAIIRQYNKRLKKENKSYTLNERREIDFREIWNNFYQTTIFLRRDSSKSLRSDYPIDLTFYYNWDKLVFFWDRNKNWRFDKYESYSGTKINRAKEEKVTRRDRYWKISYYRPLNLDLDLSKIMKWTQVKSLKIKIQF